MLSSQGYAVAFRRRPAPLTGKAFAMLAILASLAIAGAGVAAMASIVATVHSQWPAIRRLLADARTLDANSLEQGEWLDQVGAFDQVGALDHAAVLARMAGARAQGARLVIEPGLPAGASVALGYDREQP